MAWMEHGLQILLKRYTFSIEDKMAAGAFGRATNYGKPNILIHLYCADCCCIKWKGFRPHVEWVKVPVCYRPGERETGAYLRFISPFRFFILFLLFLELLVVIKRVPQSRAVDKSIFNLPNKRLAAQQKLLKFGCRIHITLLWPICSVPLYQPSLTFQ